MTLDPLGARTIALNEVDRIVQHQRWLLLGAATLELAFLAIFLFAMDFSNRTHVLLLLSTVTVYSTIAVGLMVLAARIDGGVRRAVAAIDAARRV
jgi:hypothetical protein